MGKINGVLTNKKVFTNNNIIYMVGESESKGWRKKFEIFMAKELLGIRIIE